MGRPRTTNKHLPKYVSVIHSAYWYRPPAPKDGPTPKPVRIGGLEEGERKVWQFMADHVPAISSEALPTMADVLDRYQREILPTLGVRTQKDYARHLKLLRLTFGHMRPGDIKPKHLGKFIAREKGKIQANRQLAVLSAVFGYAIGFWYIDGVETNPCRDVKRNPSKRRTRYITDKEFEAVYFIMPPRMQLAMDFALLTGQRQGDLLDMKWEHVEDGYILFKQSKTGKKLAMRISEAVQNCLERAKKFTPQVPREYVIQPKAGGRYTGEGFRAIWQRGMKKALKRAVIGERFTFHDIRAKTVSDTQNLQDAMDRAGHTSMAMTRGTYDRGTRKVQPLK